MSLSPNRLGSSHSLAGDHSLLDRQWPLRTSALLFDTQIKSNTFECKVDGYT